MDTFMGLSSAEHAMNTHTHDDKEEDISCAACSSARNKRCAANSNAGASTSRVSTSAEIREAASSLPPRPTTSKAITTVAASVPAHSPVEVIQIISKTSNVPRIPRRQSVLLEVQPSASAQSDDISMTDVKAGHLQPDRAISGPNAQEAAVPVVRNDDDVFRRPATPPPQVVADSEEPEAIPTPASVAVTYANRRAKVNQFRLAEDVKHVVASGCRLLKLERPIRLMIFKVARRSIEAEIANTSSPQAIAAAAIYLVCQKLDKPISQVVVSAVCHSGPTSLRKVARLLEPRFPTLVG